MQIVKKINNNVALAQDSKGNELVVFGKGIGFPAMPYELDDLSRIQRTFYNVSKRYVDLLPDLPEALMLAAGDIVEEAQDELDCELNPNLPFILADHLHFAIQRVRQGVALQTPLSYDVKHLYPKEYQIAARGMRALCEQLDVRLPESETVSVALHLINAEGRSENMHDTMANVQLIAQLSAMVEDYFHIQIDRDSFNYSRLAMAYAVSGPADERGQPHAGGPRHPGTVPLGQDRVPPGLRLHPPHHRVAGREPRLALHQRGTAVPGHAHPPGPRVGPGPGRGRLTFPPAHCLILWYQYALVRTGRRI